MSIHIKNAFKQYNSKVVLDIDELHFEKGFIYALMGLNGSGKSTLLRCSSGLDNFSGGKVFYNGGYYAEDMREAIAVMLQKPYLFSGTVLDNIELGLKFRKFSKEKIQNRVKNYLNYLDIGAMLNSNAGKLSGGEQAKTALLRTAVLEAEFTFLDEPTASMDIESTLMAERLIKSMVSSKRTVVLVTHDLYQAERIADYIVFLDKGKVIEKGEKYKVFNAPKHKMLKQILKRGEVYDKNCNFNY
jgi:tungstate transport system ATP-binding protein